MHTRTLGVATLTAALILVPTAAHAAGSDAPTPYTVTATGLTLHGGTTFEEHGHINYRVTDLDGTGSTQFNVHQSVPHNNQWPRAAYVGMSTYPWADHPAFLESFPDGHCITWVQVSLFDEHFGEGGQDPVCTTPPEPAEPVAPAGPVDPVEPAQPPVAPPVEPFEPAGPVGPTTPVEPAAPPAPTVEAPSVPDSATGEPAFIAEVLSANPPLTSEVLAAPTGRLASTGLPAAAVGALGLATVAGGSALVVLAGRRRPAPDRAS